MLRQSDQFKIGGQFRFMGNPPDIVAGAEIGVDHFGIPLSACPLAQNGIHFFVGHSFAVGPIAAHGVEGVGHGQDAGFQQDSFGV